MKKVMKHYKETERQAHAFLYDRRVFISSFETEREISI